MSVGISTTMSIEEFDEARLRLSVQHAKNCLSSTRIITQVYFQVTDVHFDVQKLSRLVSNGSKSGRMGFD